MAFSRIKQTGKIFEQKIMIEQEEKRREEQHAKLLNKQHMRSNGG